MEPIRARLVNPQQGHALLTRVFAELKPWLFAGHGFEILVRPRKRSLGQNALLHAMLRHLSQNQEWAGKKISVDAWKRLFMAAWLRTRGEPVEFLPALDGHGVDIVFARSSELSEGECRELLEYVFAWGAEHDMLLPARPELEFSA